MYYAAPKLKEGYLQIWFMIKERRANFPQLFPVVHFEEEYQFNYDEITNLTKMKKD